MCLIIFSWYPHSPRPLVLGANRDEFHRRPSQDAHFWPDVPHIFAGRDLQMMGTWLGLSKHSGKRSFRLAAVTNVRQADRNNYARSRGDITRLFLASDQPALNYCESIPLAEYAGFNGIFYDGQSLAYIHHNVKEGAQIRQLPAGKYALSNARLDTPWPKVERSRQALDKITPRNSAQESGQILFEYLQDTRIADDASLPDTGVGLDLERMLSAAFIISPDYGTRTSTSIIIDQCLNSKEENKYGQSALFIEHQFGRDGTKQRRLSKQLS